MDSTKTLESAGNEATRATETSLAFYAQPGKFTSAGRHTQAVAELPGDVGELCRIVQGLCIHEHMAKEYGLSVQPERRSESHLRYVAEMLDRVLALDPRPFGDARPPENRLVGVCDHFAKITVAALRARGVPARARYGFGNYFRPEYFEEHVVCEYFSATEQRWVLVDPQFDALWRRLLRVDHDVLDVPRDRFLTASVAWEQCRIQRADPARFGIFVDEQRGQWFIAGELIRDLASLNGREMLPWDLWGAMPKKKEPLGAEQLTFFDRLATLTRTPDECFPELRTVYETDERVRVPETVLNVLLNRLEAVG